MSNTTVPLRTLKSLTLAFNCSFPVFLAGMCKTSQTSSVTRLNSKPQYERGRTKENMEDLFFN